MGVKSTCLNFIFDSKQVKTRIERYMHLIMNITMMK